MALPPQPIFLSGLTPREAILDTYYRISWAFDTGNWDLFESAFTTTPATRFPYPRLLGALLWSLGDQGRTLGPRLALLIRKHIATNPRIALEDGAKEAKMWIICLKQHFRNGQQAVAGSARLWGGKRCCFDMVMEEKTDK